MEKYDISYTQNRELSWLKFDKRVLEEAIAPEVPLLERLKFLSIFVSNLNEFFMVRVGSLLDLAMMDDDNIDNKSNLTPMEQIYAIVEAVRPLYALKDQYFMEAERQLRELDICNLKPGELKGKESKYIEDYFQNFVMPILSPQIIDKHHPFPFLSNGSLYILLSLDAQLVDKPVKVGKGSSIALVNIPSVLPSYVMIPNTTHYVLIEDIVLHYIDRMFHQYQITGKNVISVTRNADISPEDEEYEVNEDYRGHMKKILKKRSRLAAVRLEVEGDISKKMLKYITEQLNLNSEQVFISQAPLNLSYFFGLIGDLPSDIRRQYSDRSFEPQQPYSVKRYEKMTDQVRLADKFLSFPYESIDPFIRLLRESVFDPHVLSIKITIYRLSSSSKIAELLAYAAENGKEVTVLMELRARFDEQNNIDWSNRLEEAGCNIIYGFDYFKVHSKICLITRVENDQIVTITQIGTGNYNEKTSKLYTDFSFMTMDEKIGKDAATFFRNMATANLHGKYERLLVAPHSMKSGIMHCIEKEIEKAKVGLEGYLLFKINSLTERDIIDKLAEASQAGVKIDMIIRGICCLRPGVPGKTDNIRVVSVVGRFLEHHRVYQFGKGEDREVYISSADLMTRNISRRVEIACPINDRAIADRITEFLQIMLRDNLKARQLQSDGSYIRNNPEEEQIIHAQQIFMDDAVRYAEKNRSEESVQDQFRPTDMKATYRSFHAERVAGDGDGTSESTVEAAASKKESEAFGGDTPSAADIPAAEKTQEAKRPSVEEKTMEQTTEILVVPQPEEKPGLLTRLLRFFGIGK